MAICQTCGTAFFPTLEAVAYEGLAGAEEALGFYLEQGAGIDAMAEPVEGFAQGPIRRYLEIGCGYGLSLDYSRTMFGWDVRGVDPGFGARAGKRELGLDIIEGYLSSPGDAGPLPYDLIMCSEVLEHVFDPDGFLSVVRQTLATDGTLVLTTPNAALITPQTPAGTLIPLLSPGYHVTLYSRQGLETLLKRAGFTSVSVVEKGPTLRAAASLGPLVADLDRPLDRRRYIAYLGRRAEEMPAASPLALGLFYRQFKELVHAGEYGRAAEVSQRISDLCRLRWGHDVTHRDDFALDGAPPADLRSYHALYPFCACGILYFRSMLAWQRDHDAASARKGFLTAAAVGERLRAVLLAIGADDGETEDLVWRALGHAALAVAATDPEAAVREAESFGHTRSPLLQETMPAPIAAEMRRAIFVTLINLGHGAAAARLADTVNAEMTEHPGQEASAACALGLFALNHRKAPGEAIQWFTRAQALNEKITPPPLNKDDVSALIWRAIGHGAIEAAAANPAKAAADAKGFGREGTPELADAVMPGPLAAEMRRAVFMTLVNLGHGTEAAPLAEDIASEMPDDAEGAAPASFALGIFTLNHVGDAKRAADWFARAHAACQTVAEKKPEAAEALLWPSLYHEALALILASERRTAESRLRQLVGPVDQRLPAVGPDLRRQATTLAKEYNLSL